jgi:hypothetical protein
MVNGIIQADWQVRKTSEFTIWISCLFNGVCVNNNAVSDEGIFKRYPIDSIDRSSRIFKRNGEGKIREIKEPVYDRQTEQAKQTK